MPSVQNPRGTRAGLDALASAGQILPGQVYLLTDEGRVAIGLTSTTYETYAKQSEAGGGAPAWGAITGTLSAQTDLQAALDGKSAAFPMTRFDEWVERRFYTTNAAVEPFTGAAISSGTTSINVPAASQDGKSWVGVLLRSNTTANGGYRYMLSNLSGIYFGQKSARFAANMLWQTSFTGRTVRFGFHDTTSHNAPVDGVFFEAVGDTLSAVTSLNSVRTVNATTLTLSLDVPCTFGIEVNAAGTSARFVVSRDSDGVVLLDETNTTNIPVTQARGCGAGLVATESSTSASDIIILNHMGFGTIGGYNRWYG